MQIESENVRLPQSPVMSSALGVLEKLAPERQQSPAKRRASHNANPNALKEEKDVRFGHKIALANAVPIQDVYRQAATQKWDLVKSSKN